MCMKYLQLRYSNHNYQHMIHKLNYYHLHIGLQNILKHIGLHLNSMGLYKQCILHRMYILHIQLHKRYRRIIRRFPNIHLGMGSL
jgi:hypothetical protein